MKPRTCPHCNYQYPFSRYLSRLFFKTWKSVWPCSNCHKPITFNRKRRFTLAVLFGLWIFILILGREVINNSTIKWVVSTALFLIGSVYIYSFDIFDKHAEPDDTVVNQ